MCLTSSWKTKFSIRLRNWRHPITLLKNFIMMFLCKPIFLPIVLLTCFLLIVQVNEFKTPEFRNTSIVKGTTDCLPISRIFHYLNFYFTFWIVTYQCFIPSKSQQKRSKRWHRKHKKMVEIFLCVSCFLSRSIQQIYFFQIQITCYSTTSPKEEKCWLGTLQIISATLEVSY